MFSMTGMGRIEGRVLGSHVRIEVKSINHRYCEVNTRLPVRFLPLEIKIQQLIKKILSRGKVDLYIYEDKQEEPTENELNAYQAYFNFLNTVKSQVGLQEEIKLADLTSGVHSWLKRDVDIDEAWKELEPLVVGALDSLKQMRKKEGEHLKDNILDHFKSITELVESVRVQKDDLDAILEEKLKERIEKKLEDYEKLDPERLHTEVIYYLDRMDITEELQRLDSHLKKVEQFLESQGPVGRKMDFLIQEFNREFNTIASKSQKSEISHLVVDAKAELEKIREQIQNIE